MVRAKTKKPNPEHDLRSRILAAANSFQVGEVVRHCKRPELGTVTEVDFRLAIPVIWVQPEKDEFFEETPPQKPYNPLELVKVDNTSDDVDPIDPLPSEISDNGFIEDDFYVDEEVESLEPPVDLIPDPFLDEELEQDVPEADATKQVSIDVLADVEVVAPVEVVDSLTSEEERDRHRLELRIERGIEQVERSFYEMGKDLAELRDRKLYRSTHKKWVDYCNERFTRMKRRQADYFILASEVVDDLRNRHNCACFPLPTSESQVRSMKDLTPEQRREVWQKGVAKEGKGIAPSAKTVKGIVEEIKERDNTPPPPEYSLGDVVAIRASSSSTLRPHDGMWGIVTHVGTWSYTIHISVRSIDLKCKGKEVEKVDDRHTTDIKLISERISRLVRCDDLATTALGFLEALERKTCFNEDDIWFLEKVEERYRSR